MQPAKTNRWLVAAVFGMAAWLSAASIFNVEQSEIAAPLFVGQARAQAPAKAEEKNPPKGMEDLKKNAAAFKRGAKPTPKAKIFAAKKFSPTGIRAIPQVAYIPAKLDYWGNNQDGDCVTAEEAFNQDANGVFIDSGTVTSWASKRGVLNGADLSQVMDMMQKDGFVFNGKTYGDGGYTSVDFSNEATLQAALAIGVVKIGIDADALPSGAGNQQGWFKLGGKPGQFSNEDHCVSLAGYGPAAWLFQQLGVALPTGVDGTKVCYLLFTWSTIGVVDHDWIMSTVGEAWLRNPGQTINGVPSPNPGPTAQPPVISSPLTATVAAGAAFSYQITATNMPTTFGAAGLPAGITCAATTGLITGTAVASGTFSVGLSATNATGTGTATLTLTVTGTPTPPAPTLPTVDMTSDQIVIAVRTGKFTPTPAQMQQFFDGSGLTTISGDDKFRDVMRKMQKCAESPPSPFKSSPVPMPPISSTDAEISSMKKDIANVIEGVKAIMDKLAPVQK